MKEKLGVEPELVPGSGGVFQVSVDGQLAIERSLAGFPSEGQIIVAVAKAMGR